jgi:hypothetical protein
MTFVSFDPQGNPEKPGFRFTATGGAGMKRTLNPSVRRNWTCVSIVAMIFVFAAASAPAQEPAKLLPIGEVPAITLDYAAQREAAERGEYHREGPLERIDRQNAVVADVIRPLAENVRYYSVQSGAAIAPSQFKPGSYVGLFVNDAKEVVSLWLIEP